MDLKLKRPTKGLDEYYTCPQYYYIHVDKFVIQLNYIMRTYIIV